MLTWVKVQNFQNPNFGNSNFKICRLPIKMNESQPQNPEFRINPENFHPCAYACCTGEAHASVGISHCRQLGGKV